jgi:hypothetical protein
VFEELDRVHGSVSRRRQFVDPEWPLFYAWWLVKWSALPEILGFTPTQSRLVFELVRLDREYRGQSRDEPWPRFYGRDLATLDWTTDG